MTTMMNAYLLARCDRMDNGSVTKVLVNFDKTFMASSSDCKKYKAKKNHHYGCQKTTDVLKDDFYSKTRKSSWVNARGIPPAV